MNEHERAELARGIIDANLYMTLATADREGRPWASPVYYAVDGYREFVWVSDPDATHSRNLAARPQIAIVIFDSTQPINTGRGVYMSAHAEPVADPEIDRALEIFSDALGGARRRGVDAGAPRAARRAPALPRDARPTIR